MSIAIIAANTGNPIDLVEEVVTANEWPFDRTSEDELAFKVSGRWCTYQLYCMWHSSLNAMLFAGRADLTSPEKVPVELYRLLAMVNALTWLGHFDLSPDRLELTFRQTMLLRGGGSTEQLEDLVEISVNEYERFYPAFRFVLDQEYSAEEAIKAALVEVVGEA